jgi:hypothetical protein
MTDHELAFLFVAVLTGIYIIQMSNRLPAVLALVLALVGLSVFSYFIILQIDRLRNTRWTLLDIIIVAEIIFIVIWVIPDISNIIRRRNQK